MKKTISLLATILMLVGGSQISNAAGYDPVLDPLPSGFVTIKRI